MELTSANWTAIIIGLLTYALFLATMIYKVRKGQDKSTFASETSVAMAFSSMLITHPIMTIAAPDSYELSYWFWVAGYLLLISALSFGVHRLISWRWRQ